MKKSIQCFIAYIAVATIALLWLLPVMMLALGSVWPMGDFSLPLGKGFGLTLESYRALLQENRIYFKMFWNSAALAVGTALAQGVVSLLVGFALAKGRIRGGKALLFLYISVMLMPFQVTLLPNYMAIRWLGLYNTGWALALPGIFAPLGVFLIYQFLRSMPDELLDAAKLDTNSYFALLWRIVLPSVQPGMITLLVLSFTESWNMVEQPLLYLTDPEKYPLSLALNNLTVPDASLVFAAAVLYLLPVLFLYRFFENQIAQGLSHYKL